MRKSLRLVVIVLAISMLLSSMAIFAEAKWVNMYGSYRYYATATLTNKRKDAYIKISTYPTICSATSVKLTNTRGGYIWSEERAISFASYRVFRLGCDHPAYRVYVKTFVWKSGCTGGCYINPYSNVRVS